MPIRKGKRKHKHNPRKRTKKDNQSKEGQREERQDKKQSKETKTKDKRIKTRANTQQAIKPPNYSRVQKPHKPCKARKQHKPTQTTQTTLKTPLKREIEPYLQATRQEQSSRTDKRREHATKWRTTTPKSLPPATSGHTKRQASRPHFQPFSSLDFKNILVFCPLWSPIFPRKHQAPPKIYSLLPLFAPIV